VGAAPGLVLAGVGLGGTLGAGAGGGGGFELGVSTFTNSSMDSDDSFLIPRNASAANSSAVARRTSFSRGTDGSVRTCSHASRTTASTSNFAPWVVS
jgi:hypothetical protein